MTIATPKLALVTDTGCNLHIDIAPPETATLHTLDIDGQGKIVPTASRRLSPGSNPVSLSPGLYHLQVQRGASCSVVDGQCSIVALTDGEDPWPTPPQAPIPTQPPPTVAPPSGGHKFLKDHLVEVRSYFSRA